MTTQRTNTNAINTTFGIEIETHLPNSDTTPVGRYHNGLNVSWLEGWKIESDTSINAPFGRKGAEFVSPVLSGPEGLANVNRSVKAIKERGAKVNASCGIHVTFGFEGDTKTLARLITLFANHEKAIYASTGTKRREQGYNGREWCKGIKQYGNDNGAKQRAEGDRYHMMNLTHLAAGRSRIEIRAFASSLNVDKITGYIMMVLGLVELANASSRKQSWEYTKKEGKRGPWDREGRGEGETEVHRLYYRLGWTKGHARKQYGLDLLSSETPTLKEVKKEFNRLAKQYDQQ